MTTIVCLEKINTSWSCSLRLQRRRWTQSHRFLWPKMTGWENHARFLSLWREPLLSACRFPQFETCNLPCVYTLFRLHSITRYVFKTLQEFASEGQNMTFNVNTLLTCILYCDLGPGWLIRTVCNIVITDIIFVLVRFSS